MLGVFVGGVYPLVVSLLGEDFLDIRENFRAESPGRQENLPAPKSTASNPIVYQISTVHYQLTGPDLSVIILAAGDIRDRDHVVAFAAAKPQRLIAEPTRDVGISILRYTIHTCLTSVIDYLLDRKHRRLTIFRSIFAPQRGAKIASRRD
ncbi:hypothetical protein Aduo_013683 [Ancylostoma duodenale]